MNKFVLLKYLIISSFLLFSLTIFSQDDEEVVVIGTLIKGTPIDTGNPVSIFDKETLAQQGNLSLMELVKLVPSSTGMDGESNQFGSNGSEGVANINLRGLGPQRTLVLVNGNRFPTIPLATGANRSVNINQLPIGAMKSIEILKEGAAATYGSDAISGVVNFTTDIGFQGFEVNGSARSFEGTDGPEAQFSFKYGAEAGGFDFLFAGSYMNKRQLAAKDTDFAIMPYATRSPDFGRAAHGWSTMGNPGSLTVPESLFGASAPATQITADPGCVAGGGQLVYGFICGYQYAWFDNVQEDEEHGSLFFETEGIVNDQNISFEVFYGQTDVPNWATSPSYPPNNPAGNSVPINHPGLLQLQADYPAFNTAVESYKNGFSYPGLPGIQNFIVRTRPAAAAGIPWGNENGAEMGSRRYDTMKLAFSIDGDVTDTISYTANFNYGLSAGTLESKDTLQWKFAAALHGYGGPNCGASVTSLGAPGVLNPTFDTSNGAQQGVGDCKWLNPFSNAIELPNQNGAVINPTYEASLANDPEVLKWMIAPRITEAESSVAQLSFNFQGEMAQLGGGMSYWLAGYEFRQYTLTEEFDTGTDPFHNNPKNLHDGTLYPCKLPGQTACNPKSGLFMFLAPAYEIDGDRSVNSAFMELALPITDNFDMQLAVRYEDTDYGSSADPKVTMKWDVTPAFAFRLSAQSTFRAPNIDETKISPRTALVYVGDAGAFKANDLIGNPNLDPEKANTYNFGIITNFGSDNWIMTMDYYQFDFDNPIITESYNQILTAYKAGAGADELPDPTAASHLAVQSQVFGGATTLDNKGGFASEDVGIITSFYVNGPATKTSGIDYLVKYEGDVGAGTFVAAFEGTSIQKYDVDPYLKGGVQIAAAYECAGYFNFSNSCRPMPKDKGKAYFSYTQDRFNTFVAINAIGSYEDRRYIPLGREKIDSFVTYDWHVSYNFTDQFSSTFSIYNIENKNPPLVNWEMNYDPTTHNPLGRIFKLGFTYRLEQ